MTPLEQRNERFRPFDPPYRAGTFTFVLLAVAALYLGRLDFDPEAPGLGNTTRVPPQFIGGEPVRDNRRPILEVLESLPSRREGVKPIVWIGNSHQHAINDARPGQSVSSVYLHELLNGPTYPGRYPSIGISYANLRYEEQFLLTLALAQLAPEQRPALIVHGVRFHDAREMGIAARAGLRQLLQEPGIVAWIEDPPVPEEDFAPALARIRMDLASVLADGRKEEGMEAWLVRVVGPYVPIFQRRSLIDARFSRNLMVFRDWVFRIDTTSKRPVLASRYEQSMQFLELALHVAQRNGIETFLYNVPIRQEVRTPYVAEEYQQFREDLAAMSARHGASFRDYDELIPPELWGTWYDTDFPDFSHFTSAGHRILARQTAEDIAPILDLDTPLHALRADSERGDALQ